MIKQIPESLLLPDKVTIAHVTGHQEGTSMEATGNRLTDEATKRASLGEKNEAIKPNLKHPNWRPKIRVTWQKENDKEAHDEGINAHWGPQAMYDTVLRNYGCLRIYTIATQVYSSLPEGD